MHKAMRMLSESWIQSCSGMGRCAATGQPADIDYGAASTFTIEGKDFVDLLNRRSKGLAYWADMVKESCLPRHLGHCQTQAPYDLAGINAYCLDLGICPILERVQLANFSL